MPGWLVSVALAATLVLVLLGLGGSEPVIILLVMGGWFVVLALLALAVETGVQALGRLLRRGP